MALFRGGTITKKTKGRIFLIFISLERVQNVLPTIKIICVCLYHLDRNVFIIADHQELKLEDKESL